MIGGSIVDISQNEKIILSLYRNKSFTKAASELGITQPALSAAVNKIEKNVGIKIFDRKKVPIKPTEEGSIYIEYLKENHLKYQECMHKINDVIAQRDNQITIGAPAAYAFSYLPDVVSQYHDRYPECKITIRAATLPELQDMSKDGTIDCFVSTTNQLDATFSSKVVGKERIFLCVPKNWEINEKLQKYQLTMEKESHTISSKNVPIIEDWSFLSDNNMIMLENNQPLQIMMNTFLKKEGLEVNGSVIVNQVLLGLQLASKGIGMMLASEAAIRSCQGMEQLVVYGLPDELFRRDLYLSYNKEYYISKPCENLINMLISENTSASGK